ncbi:MAG: HutD/Ves family protein [Actinomycetes bacterium]
MTAVRALRSSERRPVAWKNGGGRTWQVASQPAGADVTDFDWRVSIAEIAAPGPFSAFPGVDRAFAVLAGNGVELLIEGAAHVLRPREPFAFPGDQQVTCRPLGGTTSALNVMTRRGHARASVEFLRVSADAPVSLPGDTDATCVVLVVEGRVSSTNGPARLHLEQSDGVSHRGPDELVVRGDRAVIAVTRLRAAVH